MIVLNIIIKLLLHYVNVVGRVHSFLFHHWQMIKENTIRFRGFSNMFQKCLLFVVACLATFSLSASKVEAGVVGTYLIDDDFDDLSGWSSVNATIVDDPFHSGNNKLVAFGNGGGQLVSSIITYQPSAAYHLVGVYSTDDQSIEVELMFPDSGDIFKVSNFTGDSAYPLSNPTGSFVLLFSTAQMYQDFQQFPEINQDFQVVLRGGNGDTYDFAQLIQFTGLSPVPEPSTFALLIIGAGALLFRRKR